MNCIAVTAQKGGVAKTTSVSCLACALVELKKRVLVVDMDPQGALTRLMGCHYENLPATVGEVLEGVVPITAAIVTTDSGVDLVGARPELKGVERNLVNALSREQKLRAALDEIPPLTYDFVLIDTPPHLGDLTINALCAASHVIVPVKMTDKNALEGTADVLITLDQLRQVGITVELLPFLQTCAKPTRNAHKAQLAALEQMGEVSPHAVPALKEAEDCMFYDQPAFLYAPDSRVAMAYRRYAAALVDELVNDLTAHQLQATTKAEA